MKLSHVKKLSICAMCVALCCVLPTMFGWLSLGPVLSPIHIPVLLCGLICGGFYGSVCGVLGPVMAHLLTQRPPIAALPAMIPELFFYGLAAGLCMRFIRTGHSAADVYISQVIAMVAGRIVGGIANVIVAAATTGVYSFSVWITAYFVNAIPGIILHLILIPILVLTLQKAHVLPPRYTKTAQEQV